MDIDSDYHIDLKGIYDKYYVGLYGVNRKLKEVLREFSANSVDGSSVVFYEYLLHQPIPFVEVLGFSEDEFKSSYTLEGLCGAIETEDISSNNTFDTIEKLNQLIIKDNLYEQVTNAKKNESPSENLKKLKEAYTKSKDKDDLKRLNRYTLEEFYSQETPKIADKIGGLADHVYLLAPFATRMVETHDIVPAKNDGEWDIGYRNKKSLSDVKLFFKYCGSRFTKISYEKMVAGIFDGEDVSGIRMTSKSIDTAEGKAYYAQVNFKPQTAIAAYKELHKDDPLSQNSVNILEQLFKIIFPGNLYNNEKINGLVVPIASNKYFYGCLWLMCFREEHDEEYKRELAKAVREIVSSHYVPVMALLHENISEELLDEKLSGKNNKNEKKDIYYIPFLQKATGGKNRKPINGTEIIENGLEKLWEKRSKCLDQNTLLFKKYRVASLTMVNLIRDIIAAAGSMKKSGSSLPAALVIGGAGSGKDTIGKMLRIFTDSYFEGEEYTINLAAIKPSALVPAVMTGAEFNIFKGMKFDGFMKRSASESQFFEGLFQKIRKGIIGSAVPGKKGIVKKIKEFAMNEKKKKEEHRFKKYPTLILDEFNSMDPESQGVLLRFLENSEAVSLGSLRNGSEFKEAQDDKELVSSLTELTNCLVIGVMNEDPDEISREKAVDFLKGDSYLGGLLGDILYEHFIKIRRLRPDIKYRMMRNGRFVIEPLKNRREDIPILFHVYLKPENNGEEIPVHLSLEAMERLTSKDITWPGNIRQLQALAKHVSELVQEEIKTKNNVTVAIIERKHIDSGFKYIGLKVTT